MSRFDLFFVILDECNEANDYNIARHLLNVHRYRDSPVEAEFSAEQLARYIRYARSIKPQMTPEAGELLVEKYKQLRAGDATGSGSSYRITVRQLESLIRLSEALARLHCDDQVRTVYVQEACRLLKTSIIRVEMDNVDLTVSNFSEAAAAVASGVSQQDPIVQVVKMKYEDYLRITNMLVYKLRQHEVESADGGMRSSELIDWYLEEIEEDIGTEEELNDKKKQVCAVIERLARKDNVLLSIRQGGGLAEFDEDSYLVVHPNYVN